MKPFIVDFRVYPYDVLVCLGSTRQEIIAYLEKINVLLDQDEDSALRMDGTGKTLMLKRGAIILWIKENPRLGSGVLAHEVFHSVVAMLDRVGVLLTESSEEAYAYAIQYLTAEISKRIKP